MGHKKTRREYDANVYRLLDVNERLGECTDELRVDAEFWKTEALRYAANAEHWRSKHEATTSDMADLVDYWRNRTEKLSGLLEDVASERDAWRADSRRNRDEMEFWREKFGGPEELAQGGPVNGHELYIVGENGVCCVVAPVVD